MCAEVMDDLHTLCLRHVSMSRWTDKERAVQRLCNREQELCVRLLVHSRLVGASGQELPAHTLI